MSDVLVLLLNRPWNREVYNHTINADKNYTELVNFTNRMLNTRDEMGDRYEPISTNIKLSGLEACEEVFDVTNNPGRHEDRKRLFPTSYNTHRSVSVGDVVVVDNIFYVCCPFGWEKV